MIDTIEVNTQITLTGEEGDWYKVKYGTKEGFISKQYVSDKKVEVKTQTTSSRSSEEPRKVETTEELLAAGKKIADFASKFIGGKYVYGGTNPNTGADCTGFAYYVYNQCGYKLSRSCSVQAKTGVAVDKRI